VVDRLLWLSMEREINSFRERCLGLEPIRVGQGGWNMLNYHEVPFVKMWSPGLVPKPKDWPPYVDVVGTFFPSTPNTTVNNKKNDKVSSTSSTIAITTDNKEVPIAMSAGRPPYTPSPELANFLQPNVDSTGDTVPIVYVGFGSMVLPDLEKVIELFLQAAALLNVKIIVQIGWSTITSERFQCIATQAENYARSIKEMEEINSNMNDSLIFPSKNNVKLDCSAINDTSDEVQASTSSTAELFTEKSERRPSIGGWLAGALSKLTSSAIQQVIHCLDNNL
jgi:hypothetical protein